MAQVRAESTPLLKLLLHAAKYPAFAINGLLLGTVSTDDGGRVHIVDAVPLFHGHLNLAMAMEVALMQVDAYARSLDLRVVGMYHANEVVTDTQLGSAALSIAYKLQQQCTPQAVLLLVDNNLLGDFLSGKSPTFVQLHERREGQQSWSASPQKVELAANSLSKKYAQCIGDGAHRELADFSDHLDDLTRDWTNNGIVAGS